MRDYLDDALSEGSLELDPFDFAMPVPVPDSERQLLVEYNEALEARVRELEFEVSKAEDVSCAEQLSLLSQLNDALEARVQELEVKIQERDQLLSSLSEQLPAIDTLSLELAAAKRSWTEAAAANPSPRSGSAWAEIASLTAGLRDLFDSSDAKLEELRSSLLYSLQTKDRRTGTASTPPKAAALTGIGGVYGHRPAMPKMGRAEEGEPAPWSDVELQVLKAEVRALNFNNALIAAEKRELQAALNELRSELRREAGRPPMPPTPAPAPLASWAPELGTAVTSKPVSASPAPAPLPVPPAPELDAALTVLASRSGGAWCSGSASVRATSAAATGAGATPGTVPPPQPQAQAPLESLTDPPTQRTLPKAVAPIAAVWIRDKAIRKVCEKKGEVSGPEQLEQKLEEMQVRPKAAASHARPHACARTHGLWPGCSARATAADRAAGEQPRCGARCC